MPGQEKSLRRGRDNSSSPQRGDDYDSNRRARRRCPTGCRQPAKHATFLELQNRVHGFRSRWPATFNTEDFQSWACKICQAKGSLPIDEQKVKSTIGGRGKPASKLVQSEGDKISQSMHSIDAQNAAYRCRIDQEKKLFKMQHSDLIRLKGPSSCRLSLYGEWKNLASIVSKRRERWHLGWNAGGTSGVAGKWVRAGECGQLWVQLGWSTGGAATGASTGLTE